MKSNSFSAHLRSAVNPASEILGRILAPITVIHPGEGGRALLLTLNFFLLFSAYFTIKPIRESLILSLAGGAEIKSYAGAIQAILFALLIPAYSAMANRLPARRLLVSVYLFLASNLLVFLALGSFGFPHIGIVFFLWVGMFNLLSISQTWSLCNDLYTPEQGRRIFPLIAFGSASGAVFGSIVLSSLISSRGLFWPLSIASLLLVVCAALVHSVIPKEPAYLQHTFGKSESTESPYKRLAGGLSLVFKNRYIALIALLVLFINIVNTTSEYMLGKMVSDNARELVASGLSGGRTVQEIIGQFYAKFYFWVNLCVLVLQLFVVSRVVRKFGLHTALLALPIMALGSYSLIAFLPILPLIQALKIVENSAEYSLNNTAREMLFLPLSREEKYKAKFAVDTFFWRAGDAISGLGVFLGSGVFGLGIGAFAVFNGSLVLGWIAVVKKLTTLRHQKSLD